MMSKIWHSITLELNNPNFENQQKLFFLFYQENIKTFTEIDDKTYRFELYEQKDTILKICNSFKNALSCTYQIEEIPEEDWKTKWFESWEPLVIENVVVHPVNLTKPNTDKHQEYLHNIFIKPGLGFGTGQHATTNMLINLLQRDYIKKSNPKKICDLGTGSGILAVVANLLFKKEIIAVDIDPLAVDNAKENVNLNNLDASILLKVGGIELLHGRYSLFIANLYAELLIELKEQIHSKLENGAYLLLSGIMDKCWDELLKSYSVNFDMIESLKSNPTETSPGWHAVVFKMK
jgi:ribosomal protein L11 methyltransferase